MTRTGTKTIGRVLAAAALIATSFAIGATPASAGYKHCSVTDAGDSGPGTLRDALGDECTTIVVERSIDEIAITSPLTRSGSVNIWGNNVTISGNGLALDLLHVTDATWVLIDRVSFDDGGAFGLPPGATDGAGLHVELDGDDHSVAVVLNRVEVRGISGHGIWIDDNESAPGGVTLRTNRVTVDNSGIGAFDRDGIRVDETGTGSIIWSDRHGTYTNAGADGVELDERGPGKVLVDVRNSVFNGNGDYCLPIDPNDPPYADPTCVEDDDGDLVLDLDDGFDIDEADDGDIVATIRNVTMNDNYDEALDFDEAGEGSIRASVSHLTAERNIDEGIKFSEEDSGSVTATISKVTILDGEDDAIEIEEEDDGNNTVVVKDSTIEGNGKNGIKIEEADAGDVDLTVRRTSSTNNADAGIAAEQEDAGTGVLNNIGNDLAGNSGGELDLDGVVES